MREVTWGSAEVAWRSLLFAFYSFMASQREVAAVEEFSVSKGRIGRREWWLSKDFPLLCDVAHSAERVVDFVWTNQFIMLFFWEVTTKKKEKAAKVIFPCLKTKSSQFYLVSLSQLINIKEDVDIAHSRWPESTRNNKTLCCSCVYMSPTISYS